MSSVSHAVGPWSTVSGGKPENRGDRNRGIECGGFVSFEILGRITRTEFSNVDGKADRYSFSITDSFPGQNFG